MNHLVGQPLCVKHNPLATHGCCSRTWVKVESAKSADDGRLVISGTVLESRACPRCTEDWASRQARLDDLLGEKRTFVGTIWRNQLGYLLAENVR